MARGTRRYQRGSARRQSLWLSVELPPVDVAANSATLLGSLNAGGLALRPFTVVRTRVILTCQSDQVAATEEFGGAWAFGVTTERAVTAGIGSIPNPFGNADSDEFFFYDDTFGQFTFVGSVGTTTQVSFPADSKAMRKVGPDDNIAFMFESLPDFGATVGVLGRMLIKLH